MARRLKSPGTLGSPVAVNSPNLLILDSEDGKVEKVGSWSRVEDAGAMGGSYLQSNKPGDYLQFSATGSAFWVIFKFGPDCGQAEVTIDGTPFPTIDLYDAVEKFVPVNIAVGLSETVKHTVKIAVSTSKNPSSSDYYVKADAFLYRTTEEALSIELIDLINVINTINKINEIKQIKLTDLINAINTVNEVKLISNITDIQTIQRIHHMPIPTTQAVNGGFESGDLTGWIDPAGVATVTTTYQDAVRGSRYACNLKHSNTGIIQLYSPPIAVEDVVESSVEILSENPATEQLVVQFLTTDGLGFGFGLAKNTIEKTWQFRDIGAVLQANLQISPDLRKKHFYGIMLYNSGSTDGLYVDDFTLLTIPPHYKQLAKTLNDVSFTVAAGSSANSPTIGTVTVVPGQILCFALEYYSSATLYNADTKFQLKVDLLNTDGTENETLTYTPPNRPRTSPYKYNFYVTVPSGVSSAKIYAYFNNAETRSITITVRNVKAYPILDKTLDREGKQVPFSVAATEAGATVIYTPSTGKAAQVLGWSFICDADVVCLLRFTTSGNVIAGLPAKGAHAMNLLGLTPPTGAVNETVEIYVSGAANVKGWINVREV